MYDFAYKIGYAIGKFISTKLLRVDTTNPRER